MSKSQKPSASGYARGTGVKPNQLLELVLEHIKKRKREAEMDVLAYDEILKVLTKRPRRDIYVERPPQVVTPVSDPVFRAANLGLSDIINEVEQPEDDLFVQAENAIALAMANAQAPQSAPQQFQFMYPNGQVLGSPSTIAIGNAFMPPMYMQMPTSVNTNTTTITTGVNPPIAPAALPYMPQILRASQQMQPPTTNTSTSTTTTTTKK